ncbi:oligosaccharide flippase family protein [Candidatus Sulfidibacterium hydrothermale]|uniref:oligosaccharide flippase family protein n=1 Tax=Candidatus Sulfidibacterium hydrothermale TaxID=2875962 RepID=UPI001F0AFD8B|nr:oligosaccharide flippase family protein [Candidatus Sulfidibacterium hydrothermale]UBM62464.1 oligosaccharide flippase family protein [Candidatus Sulfidibacterium hydrothermale]
MLKKSKYLLKKLDIHTSEVLRKSFTSTIIKIVGMIAGLTVSIFLGRTIGAEGIGIINLSNRIINILIIISLLGMRQVIIKEVAIAHNHKNWKHIGDVMYSSYFLNGIIAIVLSLLLILLAPWIAAKIFNKPQLTYPLIIFLIVLTPQVFSRIFSAGLIGFRKIWQSILVDQTLSITITGILLLLFWLLKFKINIITVAIVYAIGRLVVTLTIGLYWNKVCECNKKKRLIVRKLTKTSIPLFFVAITGVIQNNGDILILGYFGSVKEVGLFSVAARLALMTSFILQITNAAVAPKIAALYEKNKIKELEKMIQQTTKGLFIIGLLPLLIFLLFGRNILSLWGKEFEDAYAILIILGIAQFINIASGAVGLILVMTGNEIIRSKISYFTLALNILLLFILTKFYGVYGAAIATAFTITILNVINIVFVRKKTGIVAIPYIS